MYVIVRACISAGDPPQTELAESRAHPGRELRAAAVDGEGARARDRLRGGEVPEHRRVLGRGRRHGYGDDNDHGRHLHEGVQVGNETAARREIVTAAVVAAAAAAVCRYAPFTGDHGKEDQILLVEIGKYRYIGFCLYRGSYQVFYYGPP